MDPLLLVLLVLALSGGSSESEVDAQDDDDDPPEPADDDDDNNPPAKPQDACGPGGAYLWDGFLEMPPGNAATYGLSPAEYSAAATVLTRVENQVYKPDFDTNGVVLCNRYRVQEHAKIPLTDTQALAMLAYWKIRNRQLSPGDTLSPYPGVDPALGAVGLEDFRAAWVLLVKNLRLFFAAAEKAGNG